MSKNNGFEGEVDPIRDLTIIGDELRKKDIAAIEKLIDPLKKEVARDGKAKEKKVHKKENDILRDGEKGCATYGRNGCLGGGIKYLCHTHTHTRRRSRRALSSPHAHSSTTSPPPPHPLTVI